MAGLRYRLHQLSSRRNFEIANCDLKAGPRGLEIMFQLATDEPETLRSQIAASNARRGGSRTLPFAFTKYGVAMLSSMPKSDRAVQRNSQMRDHLATHKDLAAWMEKLEATQRHHGSATVVVIDEINASKRRIGFRTRE